MSLQLTPEDRQWREFHSLAGSLKMANTHFYIGRKLIETRPAFNREFDKSRDFWAYTIGAHIQATNHHLCRVYDTNGDTHNLFRLINKIGKNNLKDETKKKQWQNDCDFLRQQRPNGKVDRFRKWRKKLFAHSNYNLVINGLDDFFKENPLDFQEIQSLIDDGFSILERWASAYQICGEIKKLSEFKDDYQFVLESLRLRLLQQSKQKGN